MRTIIIVLLGLLVASAEWSSNDPLPQGQPPQFGQRPAAASVPSTTVRPTPTPVAEPQPTPSTSAAALTTEARKFMGLVVPAAQVIVRAQADGVVAERLVEMGQTVAMGAPIVRLDDADLRLDAERQKARLAAIKHRITSAKAELQLLEQKAAQLQKAASTPFESTQTGCLITAAKARVGSLEEEYREEEIQGRSLERRRLKYNCLSPISGEVVESQRVRHEYVREGEVIAKVQSTRRHVMVHVPQSLAGRMPQVQFSLTAQGRAVDLEVVQIGPNADVSGDRLVTLGVPVNVELAAGKTVELEVSVP